MSNSFPSMISNEPPPLEQSDDEDEDSGDLRNFGDGLKLDVDPSPFATPVKHANVPARDESDKSISNEDTDFDEPLPADKPESKTIDLTAAKPEDGIPKSFDSFDESKERFERPLNNFNPFPTTMKTSYIGSMEDDSNEEDLCNSDIDLSSGIVESVKVDGESMKLSNGLVHEDSFQKNKISTESTLYSTDTNDDEFGGFKEFQVEHPNSTSPVPTAQLDEFRIQPISKSEPASTGNEISNFQADLPINTNSASTDDFSELNDFKSDLKQQNSADYDFNTFAGPIHVEVLQSTSVDTDESCDDSMEVLENKKEAEGSGITDKLPNCDVTDKEVEDHSSIPRFDASGTQEPNEEDEFGDFADFTGFSEPLSNPVYTVPAHVTVSASDTIANIPSSTADLESFDSLSSLVSTNGGTAKLLQASEGSSDNNLNNVSNQLSSGLASSFPDDDFGDDDFDEFQSAPSAPPPVAPVIDDKTDTNTSSLSKDVASNVIWTASQVEDVLKTLFTRETLPEDVPGELRFRPIDKEITEDNGDKEWRRVEDFEGSQGLLFKWLDSASYQKLLGSLRIDNSTIVYKSKWGIVEVPRFAASLVDSPLLPESSAKSSEPEPSVSGPIGAQSEVLHRSDGVDVVANDSSSPLEDNVLPNFSNKPESPSSGNSMSAEAERIVNQLPDLSYMRAKTLVFPTNNLHA